MCLQGIIYSSGKEEILLGPLPGNTHLTKTILFNRWRMKYYEE